MLTKRLIISKLRRYNLLPEDYNDKSQEELLEHLKNIDWQAQHFAVEAVKKLIRITHNPITGGTGSSDYWNTKIPYKRLNRNQKVKYTFYKNNQKVSNRNSFTRRVWQTDPCFQ